jgi:hypothetical protein
MDEKPTSTTDQGGGPSQAIGPTAQVSRDTVAPGAKRHFPGPETKCHDPHHSQKDWLDNATSICAFVAAIGGIVAGIAGGYQGWVARDTERRSLRAYVLVEDMKNQRLQISIGQKVRWDIEYVNYGQSMTLNEATDAHVWLGKNAVQQMSAFFSKPALPQPKGMARFITPPNVAGTHGFHYITLFSENVIDPEGFSFIKENDAGVVMAGRVWYTDIFGVQHWTDFCRYTLTAGGISDCPSHNEVH